MTLPNWLLSSTGEGLSKRAVSALTFIVAVAGFFGIQITGLDIEGAGKIVGEAFAVITGAISLYQHINGWARAIRFKRLGVGKFAPKEVEPS